MFYLNILVSELYYVGTWLNLLFAVAMLVPTSVNTFPGFLLILLPCIKLMV